MSDFNEYESIPNAYLLLSSMRSVGYTEETAIADIIDNCISASATRIYIKFDWENKRIVISDNGYGMSKEVLIDSMKIGSTNPNDKRKENDLGRFGMGMKTAAFSFGKRLTVLSKKNGTIANACWDLERIEHCNEWKMVILDNTYDMIAACKDEEKEFESGTMVIIDKLDKLIDENNIQKSENKFYHVIEKIKTHISLVFHRFIEEDNLVITVNKNIIKAWNPFIIGNKATQELSKEVYYEGDKIVIIEPYILPHKTKFDSEEQYYKAGGQNGWLQHQGFYVYRNRRLLVYGTWFNIFKKEISYNLARIKLDIESNSDFDWQIDIKKSKAVPPIYIEELLEKVATICAEKSSLVYNSRGTYTKNPNKNNFNLSYVWEQRKNKFGKYSFFLNKKHPLLYDVKKCLDNDGIKSLDTYLMLIENFSPVMMSGVIDTNQIEITNELDKNKEIDKDRIYIKKLIDIFRKKGFEDEEIVETLSNMASYKYMKEYIKCLVKGDKL